MKIDSRTAVIERPNGAPAQARGAWEYRSQTMEADADLSQYGAEGWECYAVVAQAGDRAAFYFKRRR